jgi:transcriptional regulator with XRE-family HTH domain
MQRTHTNQVTLARLAGLTQSHLSYILTGGRRCSLDKALRLSAITGVPIQQLVPWNTTPQWKPPVPGRKRGRPRKNPAPVPDIAEPSTLEQSFKSD